MLLEEENTEHLMLFLSICYTEEYTYGIPPVGCPRHNQQKDCPIAMTQPGQLTCCWKEIIMLKD